MRRLQCSLTPVLCMVLLGGCGGGSRTSPIAGVPALSSVVRTQAPPASCLTHRCIYTSGGLLGLGSQPVPLLRVFRVRENGKVVRVQGIGGNETNLNLPGVAVDATRNIYAAGGGTVTVYPPGSNGNVAPSRTISGAKTGLDNASGIAVDARDKIYVANSTSITEYAAGSNGNVKPTHTISGPRTGLASPSGVAIDAKHNIYVMNSPGSGTPSVTVYAPGSHGNVAPIQTIAGPNTEFIEPSGIALDAADDIYVTSCGPSGCGIMNTSGAVLVFASGANGNVAPMRVIEGGSTDLVSQGSIALDTSGKIYVMQYYNNGNGPCQAAAGRIYVFVYSAGANGNATPIQQFQSENCPPAGVAVR